MLSKGLVSEARKSARRNVDLLAPHARLGIPIIGTEPSCILTLRDEYRDLLPKWRDLGHRAAVAHELECVAYMLSRKIDAYRAVVILGAADSLRRRIESSPTPQERVEYEKELTALRGNLEEVEFEKAWAEGQKLSMDEAIALAMQED